MAEFITTHVQEIAAIDSLDKYHELRRLLIDRPALASVYAPDFAPAKISVEQRYYICSLIAFCEGLYLTDQIEAFASIKGGNWRNFIKHTLSTTAINQVWQEETSDPKSSDFAEDFITFANKLLAS
jgi:hypothetical protein